MKYNERKVEGSNDNNIFCYNFTSADSCCTIILIQNTNILFNPYVHLKLEYFIVSMPFYCGTDGTV